MRKNTFTARLNRHFARIGAGSAAVAGVGVAQHNADAALIYSGIVNINVPSTVAGVYLNVVTGISSSVPTFAPGWDLNPWGNTSLNIWTNNLANPANTDGVIVDYASGSSTTLIDNLPLGAFVDATSSYGRTAGTETTGATAFNLNSSSNIIGFRFYNEPTSRMNYGWARFSLSSATAAQPRTLIEYAYDDTGQPIIGIGWIPEPASLGLLAAGAAGLAIRRRK